MEAHSSRRTNSSHRLYVPVTVGKEHGVNETRLGTGRMTTNTDRNAKTGQRFQSPKNGKRKKTKEELLESSKEKQR